MGKGSNRRTRKMIRIRSRKKLLARRKARIAAGKKGS